MLGRIRNDTRAQSSTIISGIVVAAALLVGVFVIASIFGAIPATDTETVQNESITVDYQNLTEVSKVGDDGVVSFKDDESVYNSNGKLLTEGTDYQFYTNGTVDWFNTSDTTDGNTGSITYSYTSKPMNSELVVGRIGDAMLIGAVVVIVMFSAVILRVLRSL